MYSIPPYTVLTSEALNPVRRKNSQSAIISVAPSSVHVANNYKHIEKLTLFSKQES